MHEWFADESFWIDTYPFVFPPSRWQEAELEARHVLELLPVRPKTILDLCCGPGRHAVELARRGFSVTGVDRTPFLLDKARAYARRVGARVEWVQQDMREFVRPESFDLCLNLFTSFGYFDDKQDDLRVLRNVRECLRPGGVLVLDVVGKEWLASTFVPARVEEGPDGMLLVQRSEVFDDWTRIRNEWIVIRGGVAKTYRFHHTVYSGQELKDRLAAAGLREIRLYGGVDGRPYDRGANRIVAVCSR